MNQQKHQQMKTSGGNLCLFWHQKLRNSAAFHVKIARLQRNIMLQAPVLPLWASYTSRCPLWWRCLSTLWGERNVLKGFLESSVSQRTLRKPPQLFLFYPKNNNLNISYIKSSLVDHAKMQKTNLSPFSHVKNSALEVAKLASLSKSYKEPKGRMKSWTYLDLLDLVGFFGWISADIYTQS